MSDSSGGTFKPIFVTPLTPWSVEVIVSIQNVLFVCMGNICRSPAAEGVLQSQINDAKLQSHVEVDSAGTIGYHTGNRADARMRQTASVKGYDLQSRARQVTADDLRNFDLVVAMDRENLAYLKDLASKNAGSTAELRLFSEFLDDRWPTDVPDPYYGEDDGFQYVLEMLEAGCPRLLKQLIDNEF